MAFLSDDSLRLLIEVLHAAFVGVEDGMSIITNQLTAIDRKVDTMSGDLQARFTQEIEALKTDVAAQTTEVASVRVAFNGIGKQLADAIQEAKNAGATEAQLAAVQAVHQGVLANTQGMVEAVAQGTPSEGQTGTAESGGNSGGAVSGGSDASGDASGSADASEESA